MPKATLTFDLPEEQVEYSSAVHGADWKLIVYEVSMFLRNALKHGHNYTNVNEALEAAKTTLWDECQSYGLDPWED